MCLTLAFWLYSIDNWVLQKQLAIFMQEQHPQEAEKKTQEFESKMIKFKVVVVLVLVLLYIIDAFLYFVESVKYETAVEDDKMTYHIKKIIQYTEIIVMILLYIIQMTSLGYIMHAYYLVKNLVNKYDMDIKFKHVLF